MKASNPKVMIQAYRLLVERMQREDMHYPLHLGVTEAGDGEDGRIKSAIGIGSLLADGIGDTVRVSLTEDSVHEIPVARALVKNVIEHAQAGAVEDFSTAPFDPFNFQKRATDTLIREGVALGGSELPRVVVRQVSYDKIAHKVDRMGDFKPEIVVEKAAVRAVDPRSEAEVAEINASPETQF